MGPALEVADDLGRGRRANAGFGLEEAVLECEHHPDQVRDRDPALGDEREVGAGERGRLFPGCGVGRGLAERPQAGPEQDAHQVERGEQQLVEVGRIVGAPVSVPGLARHVGALGDRPRTERVLEAAAHGARQQLLPGGQQLPSRARALRGVLGHLPDLFDLDKRVKRDTMSLVCAMSTP